MEIGAVVPLPALGDGLGRPAGDIECGWQFRENNRILLLLRHVELSPVGQVRSHECLEQLAVVWHSEVKQLVDDHEVLELGFALSKVGGQRNGA